MDIQPGDTITINAKGLQVTGTVLSAQDYGRDGESDWYIQMTDRDTGQYQYWKQGVDGGTIRKGE